MDEKEKNAAAVSLGRLGGIARKVALNKRKRKAIAKKAAEARWAQVRAQRKEQG